MRIILSLLLLGLLVLTPQESLANEKTCQGRFVNPLTDICWSCIFPISIGNVPVIGSRPDPPNPSSPICYCQRGIYPQIGITLGFWEPARLVDVTQSPYCFVNLGGMELSIGSKRQRGKSGYDDTPSRFYHVHWYLYPLLYWLNILTNFICLEGEQFDNM